MKKYIILFCCTLLGVGVALALPSFVAAVTPDVAVILAKPDDIETAVLCTGKIEAADNVEMKLSVPVRPDRIEVEAGDRVKKGQLLFTVDKEATVQAMAGVTEQSGSLQDGAEPETLVPDSVSAPSDGIVTEVNISTDKVAKASSVLMTIAKSETLQVRMSISENLISSVETGQRVIITGNGFKGVEYGGQIKKVQSSARSTATSGGEEVVVEAIAEIFNPDERIKPGFTAKVRIITDVGRSVITLPYEAVMQDSENQEFVYVVHEHWMHKRKVDTGRETDSGLEIISGVEAGDLVVARPDEVKNQNARINPVVQGG